jgi:hypothetical protein
LIFVVPALINNYLIISMDQSANKKPMETIMMTMKMATPAQDTAALQQDFPAQGKNSN